ncbi:MAG: hypothetical protein IJP19_03045 [Clostridia bacterium]|nr:hypothetical protein [Clostridia bacterium]
MFKSIKREPCFVEMQTSRGWESAIKSNDSYSTKAGLVKYQNGDIVLVETTEPVERIRLRWNDDFTFVKRVLGDAPGVEFGDMAWMPVYPEKHWAWYIQCYDGKTAHGYGVKTGCNSFCFWQLDQEGISLVLDVRNGGCGVMLKSPLVCATVVEREGLLTETPYKACQEFCKLMCEKPNLPSRPVFGLNNWYYAYGDISRESVLEDTKLTMELCADTKHRPYMLIDDGWQLLREPSYIGGPFVPNEKFGDMAELAAKMSDMGVDPGLWIRPLLTKEKVSENMLHPRRLGTGGGVFLDPSKDEVLEFVADIVKTVSDNGYKVIKYDFTAPDMMTADIYDEIYLKENLTDGGWHFDDISVTNAQIIKKLYEKIQAAAGDSLVMGCNTYNHLAAGIHQIQRSCLDTNGFNWEKTRRNGVNPLAFRMPQNNTFFIADPDCAAITDKSPHEMNVRFFEACALSGESLFISVTPGLLSNEHKKRLKESFKIADAGCQCEPIDWLDTSCPRQYMVNGEIKTFNWYDITNGVNIY